MFVDYGVYYITDVLRFPEPERMAAHADAAIRAGVGIVQLRDKIGTDIEVIARAKRLRTVCAHYDIPFIVNDRIDIAMMVDADGVHLGPKDLTDCAAREIIGPDKLLGFSANSLARIDEAVAANADYIGVGSLFDTETKADAIPLHRDVLRAMRKRTNLPLVGIGGITRKNVSELTNSGLDGVAVVSALSTAADPSDTVRHLKAATRTFHAPQAAVIDLDGVLLDTHDLWESVFTDFCKAYHIPATGFDELWTMAWTDAARAVIRKGNLQRTPTDVITEWFDIAAAFYHRVHLLPGVRKALQAFTRRIPKTIVSTALPDELTKRAMDATGIADYFQQIQSLFGVHPDKRDALYYQQLAANWGLEPRSLLLIEDDDMAIQAAKHAGWKTVHVLSGHLARENRFADEVVSSFEEAVRPYV